jgi:hypothetical protein
MNRPLTQNRSLCNLGEKRNKESPAQSQLQALITTAPVSTRSHLLHIHHTYAIIAPLALSLEYNCQGLSRPDLSRPGAEIFVDQGLDGSIDQAEWE